MTSQSETAELSRVYPKSRVQRITYLTGEDGKTPLLQICVAPDTDGDVFAVVDDIYFPYAIDVVFTRFDDDGDEVAVSSERFESFTVTLDSALRDEATLRWSGSMSGKGHTVKHPYFEYDVNPRASDLYWDGLIKEIYYAPPVENEGGTQAATLLVGLLPDKLGRYDASVKSAEYPGDIYVALIKRLTIDYAHETIDTRKFSSAPVVE